MFRMNRLRPGFDSLESLGLSSTGVAAPSSTVRSFNIQGLQLDLNGTLHGNKTVLILDIRAPLAAESTIESGTLAHFDTSGRLTTMGKVSGSFGPNNATDAPLGQLPNLSNLTLDLSNHAGSVRLTLSPSMTNHYRFKVSGGTGTYEAAYGSGSLTITFREGSNEYLLVLRSTKN